jgi:hypothetical protein
VAHNKYLYDIISPKLKDNNKQFYSYIKSKKQDASGISSLRDNHGYLHSEAKVCEGGTRLFGWKICIDDIVYPLF